MNKLMRKKNKGMTLVELIVVIAILAVLATLLVPKLTKNLNAANETVDAANLRMLQSMVAVYYADNDDYPDALSDLETDYIDAVPKVKSGDNAGSDFGYDDETGEVSMP